MSENVEFGPVDRLCARRQIGNAISVLSLAEYVMRDLQAVTMATVMPDNNLPSVSSIIESTTVAIGILEDVWSDLNLEGDAHWMRERGLKEF